MDIEALQTELREERLHSARLGGYLKTLEVETKCALLARIHRGLDHRLENLAHYVKAGDIAEALALVAECQKVIKDISKG